MLNGVQCRKRVYDTICRASLSVTNVLAGGVEEMRRGIGCTKLGSRDDALHLDIENQIVTKLGSRDDAL